METNSNYTVIGLFVVSLLVMLIGIGGWLISDSTYRNYALYYCFMNESVSGLNKDSPVKYNGVDVGVVSAISIDPKNLKQVELTFKIESNIPMTESTSATMVTQGLTGLRYIELKIDDVNAPPLKKTKYKYPVIASTPSLLVRLDHTASNMLKDFDNISDSMQTLLDQEMTSRMRNSLKHIETITSELANNVDSMAKSMSSAEIILDNTAQASQHFPSLMQSSQATLEEVRAISQQLREASQGLGFIAEQSGSAIQQVNGQVLPDMSQLMLAMTNLSEQLSELVQTLQQQPSILIRGQQPRKRGPGE